MRLFKFFPIFFLAVYTVLVFSPMVFGKLPIPADTIVGLYHPWRDQLAQQYPSGLPFKNFLITDPVRQQYVWRELAVDIFKRGAIPKWNPYSFAGAPLLANLQTAFFYPLNFLYFLLPFTMGWSWQVVLQTVLGGVFMWLYLKNLKLRPESCALGVLAWVGSGFFTAWLEWNTLVQVAVWIPLVLLSIDKILDQKRKIRWCGIFVFSLASSFFAGHLQIFFYVFCLVVFYIVAKSWQLKKISLIFLFSILLLFSTFFTAIQWVPMVTMFKEGVRSVSLTDWQNPGWFLPWQNLVQFISPDFFGNPSTLNYFGVWNYGEFVGYLGIVPLIFALECVLTHRNKKTLFWLSVLSLSLIFSLPGFLAQMPYKFSFPLISFAQPTRLMVLIDFSLAVLAASGFDYFIKSKEKKPFLPIVLLGGILVALWIIVGRLELTVSQKNLVLPTVLFSTSIILLTVHRKFPLLTVIMLLALTVFDLSRFGTKFESFSNPKWLYPETKVTRFLEEKAKTDVFRVAALDDRIFPPNFSSHYKIQMISGYDSIVLQSYANLVGSGSRITVPKNLGDPAFALLNIRYLLSFEDLDSQNYQLVLQEGQTKVYEVKNFLPRAFFKSGQGQAVIQNYSEAEVVIATKNSLADFLVLLDSFYPDWKAEVDGLATKITLTNGAFRGVTVPAGNHIIRFRI